MENQPIPQHSLAQLAKKPLTDLKEQQQQLQVKRAPNNASDATAEALEATMQRLLEVCLAFLASQRNPNTHVPMLIWPCRKTLILQSSLKSHY